MALSQNQTGGASNSRKRFAQPDWEVRYEAGTFKLKSESWLNVTFAPKGAGVTTTPIESASVEQLRRAKHHSIAILAITRDQLRAVTFDAKAEKDSALMQRMPRSGCHYAESLMPKDNTAATPEVFVIALALPGPFSRALGRLDRKHPVQLTWATDDSQGEVVLLLKDCEYASFLASLRRFAGERWTEIGHELKK